MPSFRDFAPRLNFLHILLLATFWGSIVCPRIVCAQDSSAAPGPAGQSDSENPANQGGGANAAGAGAQNGVNASQDPNRAKAIQLFKNGNYEDALPLLLSQASVHPDDPMIQELLGGALLEHAATLPDPEARRQARIAARGALLRAKALGDNSNYINIVLPNLPADGGGSPYSARADVDNAMRAAEAAFSKGDMDGALAGYQQVLKLDPQNYMALLFSGDVYYKQKDFENSYVWYGKAAAAEPNAELAFRYWGDALNTAGKPEEAREKFIEAIVASPFERASWIGLQQWAQMNHVKLTQLNIKSPNSVSTQPAGGANITIDPNTLGKHDGTESWMLYEITRAAWNATLFQKTFPNETAYRHSLPEEAAALGVVADAVSQNIASGKVKQADLDPQIAALIKLKSEGLIEAYVLLARADQGIAQDYAAYRDAHRDKLTAYMNEYVAPELK
jgi:tetratricopeptide (TPR) repeat protein